MGTYCTLAGARRLDLREAEVATCASSVMMNPLISRSPINQPSNRPLNSNLEPLSELGIGTDTMYLEGARQNRQLHRFTRSKKESSSLYSAQPVRTPWCCSSSLLEFRQTSSSVTPSPQSSELLSPDILSTIGLTSSINPTSHLS